MQAGLKEIKTELGHQDPAALTAICIRLARYKKENKELVNYLLFYADNPGNYADKVKESLEPDFRQLNSRDYFAVKGLRKILRQITKHSKFMASKTIEAEMLIWFCKNFLTYTSHSSSSKPLRTILNRQVMKIVKLSNDMEDDLSYDINAELEKIIHWAETSLRGFKRNDVKL